MNDLKHLRDVLTEAYPREELSLDALARVLAALDGLPSLALDGGWTFKGFTAWAQGLEQQVTLLQAEIDSSPTLAEWNALREDAERYRFAKTLEGQVVTAETFKNRGSAELDQALDDAMVEDADSRNLHKA